MSKISFSDFKAPEMLGESTAMATLRNQIAAAARTSAKVLIVGETGVGKEIAARQLHDQSIHRVKPFVAVNCSGVPETLLESELFGHTRGSFTGAYRDKPGLIRQASGGTLFLDELGEMSLRMQGVLLRFTETGEVQPVGADKPTQHVRVRLITATNRDLREQVGAGAFREDLYYRLNVIQIYIPPLRERRDDIPLLMQHYLERAAANFGVPFPELTSEVLQLLVAYGWPGNIRELRNVAERLALRDARRALAADDLPIELRGGSVSRVALPVVEPAGLGFQERPAASLAHPPISRAADELWRRMADGEDFWSVVHKAYKARELARQDLASIIDRGLQETRGSYRALLKVFHLPSTDYKRFHAFLYQQRCNLPVAAYRRRVPRTTLDASAPRVLASTSRQEFASRVTG
jgi:DNA-binding NtrC family response regulator